MSDYCYCDYEPCEFYRATKHTARKEHRCDECGGVIKAGTVYEYISGKTDGDLWTAKTCPNCLALREYVQAHVPCFCWYSHTMLDDAIDTLREFQHEFPPGMGMEVGRLYVRARGRRRHKSDTKAGACS